MQQTVVPYLTIKGAAAPGESAPPPVSIALVLNAPAEVDSTYKQAVAAGAKGIAEPADQFWGARFAMVTDPFGHRWMFNAQLPDKK